MPTDEHNYILNKVTLLQLEYNLILDITKILLEFRRQLKMTKKLEVLEMFGQLRMSVHFEFFYAFSKLV